MMGWAWAKVFSKESTRSRYERVLVGLTTELDGLRGAAGRLGAWRRAWRAGMLVVSVLAFVPVAMWAGVFWKGVGGMDRRVFTYLVSVPVVAYAAWRALDAVHGVLARRLDAKVAKLVERRDACLGELRTRTAGDLSYEDVKGLLDRYAGAGGKGGAGGEEEEEANHAPEGEVAKAERRTRGPKGQETRSGGAEDVGGAVGAGSRGGGEVGVGVGDGSTSGPAALLGPPSAAAVWSGTAGETPSGPVGRALARLVNALIGEEPTRCYALVCARCLAHNGLAPAEESVRYRCPCCGHLNAHSPLRNNPTHKNATEGSRTRDDDDAGGEGNAAHGDHAEGQRQATGKGDLAHKFGKTE